jgi:hypothetical protein
VSLNSASHPIVNGNFSNLLTTAANLSQTSLEQMLIQIRQSVDNNGKKIRLVPRQLIVAPGNVFQAEVLLKSVEAHDAPSSGEDHGRRFRDRLNALQGY